MEFSIKDFFSKHDQIRSFLRICSHLLKKSLMENFIFCAVLDKVLNTSLSLISTSTIENHYWPQAGFKPIEDLNLDWPERKYTLKNFIALRQKALNRNFRI